MIESLDSSIDFFQKGEILAAETEKLLSPLSYIPFVSSFTVATLRSGLSSSQLVLGISMLPYMIIKDSFDKKNPSFYRTSKCFSLIAHGSANGIRAILEYVPIINLTTLFYDKVIGSRITYSVEEKRADLLKNHLQK